MPTFKHTNVVSIISTFLVISPITLTQFFPADIHRVIDDAFKQKNVVRQPPNGATRPSAQQPASTTILSCLQLQMATRETHKQYLADAKT
jgi:hypothetical protein